MTHDGHSRRTEQEAVDWLYCALGGAVVAALVLAAVIGHAWVSVGIAP